MKLISFGLKELALTVIIYLTIFFLIPLEFDVFLHLTIFYVVHLIVLFFLSLFKEKKTIIFDFVDVVSDNNYFTEPFRIRPGIPQIVKNLRKGHEVVLFTNNNKLVADNIAKELKLGKMFDKLYSSGDVGIAKPDPKAYKALLNKLSVSSDKAVMIDDNKDNIEGAIKAGLDGVLFKSTGELLFDLQSRKLLR